MNDVGGVRAFTGLAEMENGGLGYGFLDFRGEAHNFSRFMVARWRNGAYLRF